jgi:hypothetical protein
VVDAKEGINMKKICGLCNMPLYSKEHKFDKIISAKIDGKEQLCHESCSIDAKYNM